MDDNCVDALINFYHKCNEKFILMMQKHLQLTMLINRYYVHKIFLPFTLNNYLFFLNPCRNLSTLVQNQNRRSYVDTLDSCTD